MVFRCYIGFGASTIIASKAILHDDEMAVIEEYLAIVFGMDPMQSD